MDAISPVYLLLGAVICSMVGRFMLIRAAWEVSKPWGFAVLCVPLAPFFFRRNYKELAGEGAGWLRGASLFGIGFVALTGSSGSFDDLWSIVPERFRPAEYAEHRSADSDLVSEEGDDRGEAEEADSEAVTAETNVAATPVTKLSPKATPEEKKHFFGRIATLLKGGSSEAAKPVAGTAPAATASTAAPAASAVPAASAIPAAPPLPLSVRVAANQAEFTRLGDVYEKLKKERGYLKKWDQDQIKAYNEQAAKYQTDLAKARADQVELNKLAAVVKK